MVSNQQFRLKWNNHRNTVLQEFETLLHNNSFVDCTIGADGKYLKAHKIVLSACSPYLQNVFNEHFDKHPVVLLKDVSFKELKCMIDYMYCGEVNISESELPSFLRTAQSLKIKGLAEDINDYDSASDNEPADSKSFAENNRSVEANVEIHDDEPPAKKSAPSLISANAVSNNSLAGRKRKTPNPVPISGKVNASSQSQAKSAATTAPNSSKSADASVPTGAADSETERTASSSTSENCINTNESTDSSNKKNTSQNESQDQKSRMEVKEEPVDTDADNEDNSSYECGNNDSDLLNEDSESGNKFGELSIASVSSFNENDANGNAKRISSQNARKLLSKWCEGLAGKPLRKEKEPIAHLLPSCKKMNVTCPDCGKFYKWTSSLKNHLKLECGKDPQYFCQQCRYSTHYPQDYKKHMTRVHKVKPEIVAKEISETANADTDTAE